MSRPRIVPCAIPARGIGTASPEYERARRERKKKKKKKKTEKVWKKGKYGGGEKRSSWSEGNIQCSASGIDGSFLSSSDLERSVDMKADL